MVIFENGLSHFTEAGHKTAWQYTRRDITLSVCQGILVSLSLSHNRLRLIQMTQGCRGSRRASPQQGVSATPTIEQVIGVTSTNSTKTRKHTKPNTHACPLSCKRCASHSGSDKPGLPRKTTTD
ncbi:hypothetical protein BaRGS_00002229 [Batillaria attramentaria]|uniref:Uncharacterized protein n=1 Tax=Batillaria attramentaria TaxID=370345 RepID=A0ABD0M5S5_9CAEN